MPAPLAKGLIILSSLLIAAGTAVYHDPVVKAWIEAQRRRLALALHSLGDEIDLARNASFNDPPASAPWQEDEEQRSRRRREELVRRNRNELIKKAREEGVAVDLDELAAMGVESEADASARLQQAREDADRSDRSKSFDALVGSDGTLRAATTASDAQAGAAGGLRQRGAGQRGMASGDAWANPFADEGILFDHEREMAQGRPGARDVERIELPFLPEGSMSHEDYELQLRLLEEVDHAKAIAPSVSAEVAQPPFDELYDANPRSNPRGPAQDLAALEEAHKQTMLQQQELEAFARGESSDLVTLADLEDLPASATLEDLRRDLRQVERQNALQRQSRESTATLAGAPSNPFRDEMISNADAVSSKPEMSSHPSALSLTASFHSADSGSRPSSSPVRSFIADVEENDVSTPTGSGAMTPMELELDEGFNTAASHAGTNASDIGDVDLLSDFGMESVRSGAMTPSSFGDGEWTDVDSDVGMSEDEHHPHLPQQYLVPKSQQHSQ